MSSQKKHMKKHLSTAALALGFNLPGIMFAAYLILTNSLRSVPGDIHLITTTAGQDINLIALGAAWFIGESIAAVIAVVAITAKEAAVIAYGKFRQVLTITKEALVRLLGVEIHENPLRSR